MLCLSHGVRFQLQAPRLMQAATRRFTRRGPSCHALRRLHAAAESPLHSRRRVIVQNEASHRASAQTTCAGRAARGHSGHVWRSSYRNLGESVSCSLRNTYISGALCVACACSASLARDACARAGCRPRQSSDRANPHRSRSFEHGHQGGQLETTSCQPVCSCRAACSSADDLSCPLACGGVRWVSI